ncbi:hypothetical protein Pint_17926 [Pistacia integerrima]|uniref:Uncharacterized protein n=1 Tax=Pistacia integerrima TaxID=434235 RepID=A0ACC0YUB6_9ROSI|nr:hypothetical protein Pint_17926 [Pistacia integerrima]
MASRSIVPQQATGVFREAVAGGGIGSWGAVRWEKPPCTR